MFADRTEAGRLLAQRLLPVQNQNPVVLGPVDILGFHFV
jgi:predicted phosphoribosyltransferase